MDDYGLKPPPSTGAVDIYDVISGRYEKGSIALTSNRAPDELLAQAGLQLVVRSNQRAAHHRTQLSTEGHAFTGWADGGVKAAEDLASLRRRLVQQGQLEAHTLF